MSTRVELACWGLTAVLVAAWLALVEVFWLPLRLGGVLVPLSIVVAVVANLLIPAAALRWSGSRLVAVLPLLTWLVVAVAAMTRRPEGDLVMNGVGASGVVGLAFLLLGTLAAAFSVGRVLGGPRRLVDGRAGVPAPAGTGVPRVTAVGPGD
jgi:hypothetical protein